MAKQLKLNIYKGKLGGRRPGAGRKRIHSPGIAHTVREKVSPRTPLHINFKFRTSVRSKAALKVLKLAIKNAQSNGLKIIHYSMQSNHLHFIIEASDNKTLTKGMRSLTISFARALGKGRIQTERYHLHVLRSLRETKNAIHYVLFNEQKHKGSKIALIDRYSSLSETPQARIPGVNYRFLYREFCDFPIQLSGAGSWLANSILRTG